MGLLYLHFIIMVGHFTVFCLGLVASVGHWYKCQAKLSFHAFYIYLFISGYLVELKSELWLQGKIWLRTVPSGQLYLGVVSKTNFFYLFICCVVGYEASLRTTTSTALGLFLFIYYVFRSNLNINLII